MAVATLPVALLLKYPARLRYASTGGVNAKIGGLRTPRYGLRY